KFIPYRDLFQQDMGSFGRPGPPKFVAEDKLVSEIKILSDKGVKAVVYFTQGHGELDLAGFGAGRDDWTAGQLKELLTERNFEVKPLAFGLGEAKVPEGAKVLVIAGPTQPFPKSHADAVAAFMRNGGKLLALLDVTPEPGNEAAMLQTGLEGLLAAYNV